MPEPPRISIASFTSAPPEEQDRGLLGWLTLEIAELLVVDAVALRRTRSGDLTLAFPAPRDACGRPQATVRPRDDRARLLIEAAVLRALAAREGAA